MINKAIIVGRVGVPAKKATLTDGSSYARARIATTSVRKSADEQHETTEWHTVVCFGALADILCRAQKGQLVYVEGKVTYRDRTEKAASQQSRIAEIRADTLRLIGRKMKEEKRDAEGDIPDDEIPF